MTRYFLTKVRIEGFRGINNENEPLELSFKPEAVNSVFAANGLGKSSIFEALCYAVSGKVPKLERLQKHEHPEDYLRNRFHSGRTSVIEIECQPDDTSGPPVKVRVELDSSGNRVVSSPSGHPSPERLLDSLNEDFALLDYQAFDDFIHATPLSRGRSFSALLGLSAFSDFRQTLQSAADTRILNSDLEIGTLRAEVTAGARRLGELEDRLAETFQGIVEVEEGIEFPEEDRPDAILRALFANELLKETVEGSSLEDLDFPALRKSIREAEGGEKRGELTEVVGKILRGSAVWKTRAGEGDSPIQAPDEPEDTGEGELKLRLDLLELLDERDTLLEATRGALFENLFRLTKRILDEKAWQDPTRCPLCETEIEESLEALVDRHLSAYSDAAAKTDEIKAAIHGEPWLLRLRVLESLDLLDIPEEARLAGSVIRQGAEGTLKRNDASNAKGRVQDLESQLDMILKELRERREALESELPDSLVALTEQVELASQFAKAFADREEESPTVVEKSRRLVNRLRWQEFISGLSRSFAEAEAEMAKERIKEIEADYQAMFSKIVGFPDVVPELLRAEKKEELDVQLNSFYGDSGVSARALLPESQRNALAISVFLSAALRKAGTPRFVVLDDVTSSFDAGHQWQLMEQLREHLQYPKNPDGLQFVLLSHDGLLEKYFEKLSQTRGWHHQRLEGSPPKGAVFSQLQSSNPLRATLIGFLDAGQVSFAEPLIRQYLESKLVEIISRVGIPVPLDFAMKGQKRMVSNSLEAIKAAVQLHEKAGTLVMDSQQVSDFETALVPQLVGNWVSHYETGVSSSLSAPALKAVVETIDNLAECFRYDEPAGGGKERRWYRSLSSKA